MPARLNSSRLQTVSENELAGREGLVKFDRETTLEAVLVAGGMLGILATLCLLYVGKVGGRRYSHPHPEALSYIPLAVAISLLCFVLRYFTDNYYLVDPNQHLVYYHFRFLWLRSVRLLLRREDILAVATRGRQRRSRSSTWWEYQLVVVGANGHVVPLRNWQREALGDCNAQAERLGAMLGCPAHKSPPCCILRIKVTNGQASLDFKQIPWWGFTSPFWLWGIVFGVVVTIILLALHYRKL